MSLLANSYPHVLEVHTGVSELLSEVVIELMEKGKGERKHSLVPQSLTPRVSGTVVRHGFDGLRRTEVSRIVTPSHLRIFVQEVVELVRHLDRGVDVDFVDGRAEDGSLAVRDVAVEDGLVAF